MQPSDELPVRSGDDVKKKQPQSDRPRAHFTTRSCTLRLCRQQGDRHGSGHERRQERRIVLFVPLEIGDRREQVITWRKRQRTGS